MSNSLMIEGYKKPNDKWKRMKHVFDVCKEARVTVPQEVMEYFDNQEPSDVGVYVRLIEHPCSKEVL